MEAVPPHLHSGELGYRPGVGAGYYRARQVLEGTAVRASQPAAAGRRSEKPQWKNHKRPHKKHPAGPFYSTCAIPG
ncbi:hypothetical protein EYF80_029037 [Liparis tanakae]|uniref:Uncharacterized protein n=1 Tax=Liparis tanakae TaxID=230148 RepID=A0A4Z2H6P8_9TELE|nr:hypothetical protein EYF80_029037 [Liparis tanakae]